MSLTVSPQPYHCHFCVHPPNDTNLSAALVIFLDMDGVMFCYDKTIKELEKRDRELKEKNPETYRPWQAKVSLLEKEAVKNLMGFIRKIEKTGQKVFIVISSNWRTGSTTKEVAKEMFASQPFGPYVIGRTLSTEKTDPQLHEIDDCHGLLDGIRKHYKIKLKDRGEEIFHWVQAHQISQFIIFDDLNLGIKQRFQKQFIRTATHLKKKHIQKALYLLGLGPRYPLQIKGAHCKFCTGSVPNFKNAVVLFIDLEKHLFNETLVDPLKEALLPKKFRPARIPGERDNALFALTSRIRAKGKNVLFVTYFSSGKGVTAHEIRHLLFPVNGSSSICRNLVGHIPCAEDIEEGIEAWIENHEIDMHLNLGSFLGNSPFTNETAIEAFKSLNFPKRAYHMPAIRHCEGCIFDIQATKKLKETVFIFLDIKNLFSWMLRYQKLNEENSFIETDSIEKNRLRTLMFLIRQIEASGKQVGIILTSLLGNFSTAELCLETYSHLPFSDYLIGKITLSEKISKNNLNLAIENWVESHSPSNENYLILDGYKSPPFNSNNLICTHGEFLSWQHAIQAIETLELKNSSTKSLKSSHCEFCFCKENNHSEKTVLFMPSDCKELKEIDRLLDLFETLEAAGQQIGIVLILPKLMKVHTDYFPFQPYLIGRIEKFFNNSQTEKSIQSWIASHEVSSFAILTNELFKPYKSFKTQTVPFFADHSQESRDKIMKILLD